MVSKKNNLKIMKGGEYMPLFSDTSKDWHNAGTVPNLAVNLDVGINEYTFGRTTPDNNFIVATGLVKKPFGVEMIGGSKKSKESKSKSTTQKKSVQTKKKSVPKKSTELKTTPKKKSEPKKSDKTEKSKDSKKKK